MYSGLLSHYVNLVIDLGSHHIGQSEKDALVRLYNCMIIFIDIHVQLKFLDEDVTLISKSIKGKRFLAHESSIPICGDWLCCGHSRWWPFSSTASTSASSAATSTATAFSASTSFPYLALWGVGEHCCTVVAATWRGSSWGIGAARGIMLCLRPSRCVRV